MKVVFYVRINGKTDDKSLFNEKGMFRHLLFMLEKTIPYVVNINKKQGEIVWY